MLCTLYRTHIKGCTYCMYVDIQQTCNSPFQYPSLHHWLLASSFVRTASYINALFPLGHNFMPCLWSRTLTKRGINHNIHSVLLVAICNQMILQVGWDHNHLQREWRNSSYQCYYHKEEVHTVTLTHPYLDRHTQIHTRVSHMREHPASCPVWGRGSSYNILYILTMCTV